MFEFTIDGFRIIQLIITLFVFAFSTCFAKSYFKETRQSKGARFYLVTLITFLSVIGIFCSANFYTLFIFFEIMSISSYFWVRETGTKDAVATSNFYLAISIISGMVTLMGLFMLNSILGTLNFNALAECSSLPSVNVILPALILASVGFCTKAGVYLFHVWLKDTYFIAPAPATTMLSSVLSKTGVFGVLLIAISFGTTYTDFGKIMLVFSVITMLWGGICGVCSGDMKKTIAYSSMSQIGFIFFGISMYCILEEEKIIAINGIVLHMLNHSAFKFILFSLCGVVLMKFKTTDLNKIKGIARGNKIFAFTYLVAVCGLMGVPFVSGYISKTLLHESVVEQIHITHLWQYTVFEYLFLISGGLTVCYLLKITFVIFAKNNKVKRFKMPVILNIGLVLTSIYALVCGIVPNLTMDKIADFANELANAEKLHEQINYFTWVNLKGSLISITIGVILYVLVCRPLHKKTKGNDICPQMFVLKNIYTNLFAKDIPCILGVICKFLDTTCVNLGLRFLIAILNLYSVVTATGAEVIAEILIVFGLRPVKEHALEDKTPVSYKVGKIVDKLLLKLEIRTKTNMADALSDFERHSAIRRHMIGASLSYGLFFAGLGLVAILVYMMLM